MRPSPFSPSCQIVQPTPRHSPPAALDAPVLAAEPGDSTVELSWQAVDGAARYELWTWTSAASWQQLDDGALTGTTFSHTGLTVGTTYFYWARAVNDSGAASDWSERSQATFVGSVPTSTPPSTVAMLAKTGPDCRSRPKRGRLDLARGNRRRPLRTLDLDQRRRRSSWTTAPSPPRATVIPTLP